jgi:hypothetical protein
MGVALIPNKPIFRKNEEDEYYIFFLKDIVRKASELFFIKGNQSEATLEHKVALQNLTIVESWIVESEQDKSRHYGMDVPMGTWMVSMKVNSDEVWNEYVKKGKVKGFSIEAYFSDKMSRPKDKTLNESLEDEANELLDELKDFLSSENLESYSDYPDAVSNNAKRGIDLNEKNNNKCATQVGKVRAQQLAKKEAITVQTVKRMFSYLSRPGEYYDEGDTKACGTISYLLWGGKAGLRWAGSKLRELDMLEEDLKKPCYAGYEMIGFKIKNGRKVPNCVPMNSQKLETMVVNEDYAVIDDRLAYSTQEKAEEMAANLGCSGFHTHDLENKTWFMPCESHNNDKDA